MQNLIAIFLPLIIDVVNKEEWSDTTKQWVAVGIAIFTGVLLNIGDLAKPDALSAANFLVSVGLVVGTSQGVYLKFWKDNSVRQKYFVSKQVTNPIAVDTVPVEAQQ